VNVVKLSLLVLLLAANASSMPYAIEFNSYKDPLPLGNYVEDIDGLLERAFQYDGWSLSSKPDENTYIGFISYRGYDVSVRISVIDQRIHMTLDSVYATGCGEACENLDEKPVIQWLVILRRAIALELTRTIGEQLEQEANEAI
jgi:hypothetical protein